jgi:hypothetical protein
MMPSITAQTCLLTLQMMRPNVVASTRRKSGESAGGRKGRFRVGQMLSGSIARQRNSPDIRLGLALAPGGSLTDSRWRWDRGRGGGRGIGVKRVDGVRRKQRKVQIRPRGIAKLLLRRP